VLQYAVVYYEKDGDDVYQFRVQADIVTVPDHEILQVCTSYIAKFEQL
jgi:phosphatidylinositol 3-kinase